MTDKETPLKEQITQILNTSGQLMTMPQDAGNRAVAANILALIVKRVVAIPIVSDGSDYELAQLRYREAIMKMIKESQ